MDISGIRIVTLDVGGTLVHPYPSVGEVYAKVLADHGLPARPDELQRRFGQVFFGRPQGPRPYVDDVLEKQLWAGMVARIVAPYCPPERIDAVFEDLYEVFARAACWQLAGDALTTIRRLAGAGYRTAILSNADSRLRGILGELGVLPLVSDVFISAELNVEKPDLRIFRAVEQAMAAPAAQFLHVGDSVFHDEKGARAAGWEYLILDGTYAPEQRRISSLGDILRFLRLE